MSVYFNIKVGIGWQILEPRHRLVGRSRTCLEVCLVVTCCGHLTTEWEKGVPGQTAKTTLSKNKVDPKAMFLEIVKKALIANISGKDFNYQVQK